MLLEFYRKNKITFNITVKGECMVPVLQDGEVVEIHPNNNYQKGDIVLCKDKDDVIFIHRIYDIVDEHYITKADNNILTDKYLLSIDNIYGKVLL